MDSKKLHAQIWTERNSDHHFFENNVPSTTSTLHCPLKATKKKSPHFAVVLGKLHEDFAYPGPHHLDMEQNVSPLQISRKTPNHHVHTLRVLLQAYLEIFSRKLFSKLYYMGKNWGFRLSF